MCHVNFFQLGSSNTSDTWWSPPPRVDTGGKKTTSVWFRKTSSYQNRLEMNFRVLALFLGSPYISTPSQTTSLFLCADHNGFTYVIFIVFKFSIFNFFSDKTDVKFNNESEIRHLCRTYNGSPHSPTDFIEILQGNTTPLTNKHISHGLFTLSTDHPSGQAANKNCKLYKWHCF